MREILEARERTPDLVAELDRYLAAYVPAYEGGHLLVAGGISDQPARYLAMTHQIMALGQRSDAKYRELTKEEKP